MKIESRVFICVIAKKRSNRIPAGNGTKTMYNFNRPPYRRNDQTRFIDGHFLTKIIGNLSRYEVIFYFIGEQV